MRRSKLHKLEMSGQGECLYHPEKYTAPVLRSDQERCPVQSCQSPEKLADFRSRKTAISQQLLND